MWHQAIWDQSMTTHTQSLDTMATRIIICWAFSDGQQTSLVMILLYWSLVILSIVPWNEKWTDSLCCEILIQLTSIVDRPSLLLTCPAMIVTTFPLRFALIGPAFGFPKSHSHNLPLEHSQLCWCVVLMLSSSVKSSPMTPRVSVHSPSANVCGCITIKTM